MTELFDDIPTAPEPALIRLRRELDNAKADWDAIEEEGDQVSQGVKERYFRAEEALRAEEERLTKS